MTVNTCNTPTVNNLTTATMPCKRNMNCSAWTLTPAESPCRPCQLVDVSHMAIADSTSLSNINQQVTPSHVVEGQHTSPLCTELHHDRTTLIATDLWHTLRSHCLLCWVGVCSTAHSWAGCAGSHCRLYASWLPMRWGRPTLIGRC
jgi:hypothetical protein